MIRPEIEIMTHQVQAISFMLRHNYAICGDEQGLGKTLEAIAVQQADNLDCLVICPATLKLNWLEEYQKFTDETDIVVGHKKAKINITNYEQLSKCEELFKTAAIVIFDEAHYMIHMDSQRTGHAHRMISKYLPQRCLLLSGTPIKNRVTDFYSLLVLMSYTPVKNNGRDIRDKYKTQEQFNKYFAQVTKFKVKVKSRHGSFMKEITKYGRIKNENELKIYMRFKLIRRLAKNVLTLPPLIYKDINVSYKKDTALEKEYEKFVEGKSFDVSTKCKAAVSMASFTADYIRDIVKAGEGPVIVFSDHIQPLDIIQTKLRSKFKVARIDGRTKIEDRNQNKKDFQAGLLDIILCSVGAASTGITLTASRNMVLNDIPWDAASMSQLVKRFHRIGQNRSCVVHRMSGSSIGKKIIKDLSLKMEDINKIL